MKKSLLLVLSFLISSCQQPKESPKPAAASSKLATQSSQAPRNTGQFPLSPEEGLKAWTVAPGFKVDLVAAEPHVVDPVAMCFDADGRIYVAEMLDYPFVRTPNMFGPFPEGQIRLLETDDDGKVVKSTVFATAIMQPSSVVAHDGGILVTAAPDILFLKDTDGDGRADVRRPLLTGFDDSDELYRVNSLQWGIDGWIYPRGVGDTPIRWADDPKAPELSTEGGDFRFKPKEKRFEALSGYSSCFGLTMDDYGRRFFSNSSWHIIQVVLPSHYLKRNAYLVPPSVTERISDHGDPAPIFRRSPPAAWRVERSEYWDKSGLAKRVFGDNEFSRIELRQDYMTAVAGPVIYRESAFPAEYHGSYFVCEACGNLVHRDVLRGQGPVFAATRGHEKSEFLASSDSWCCPVYATTGPDGGLYICDIYRQIIEHPGPAGDPNRMSNVPEHILQKYGMRAGSTMGRIYRVSPINKRTNTKPNLSKASVAELITYLDNPNAWWRTTAQRLLLERPEQVDVGAVEAVAQNSRYPAARVQALWTLDAIGKLSTRLILDALKDKEPGVRENALRMADGRVATDDKLAQTILLMTGDSHPSVRFQLAFTLGEIQSPGRRQALAALVNRDGRSRYMRTAILSSVGDEAVALHRSVKVESGMTEFLAELVQVIGARLQHEEIAELLEQIERRPEREAAASLRGLAEGIKRRGKKRLEIPAALPALRKLVASNSKELRKAAAPVVALIPIQTAEERQAAIDKAIATVSDESKPVSERTDAVAVLAAGDFAKIAPVLAGLVDPRQPEPLQHAALQALDEQTDPRVVDVIVENWAKLTPTVRERALSVALARKERIKPLLEAVQKGGIPPEYIDTRRRVQLLNSSDKDIAAKAKAILQDPTKNVDTKLFEKYKESLQLKGIAERGAALFKNKCLTCHKVGREGEEVGPSLASVRNHPAEQILKDILYPSTVVQPNYVVYAIATKSGQVHTGIIVSSTATSVTLRQPAGCGRERAEDTPILRKDIEELGNTKVSIMPDGLLQGLNNQEVADLLEYVRQIN